MQSVKGMLLAGKSPYSINKGLLIKNSASKAMQLADKSSYWETKYFRQRMRQVKGMLLAEKSSNSDEKGLFDRAFEQ